MSATDLIFAPLLPWPWLAALALAAALMAVPALIRGGGGAWMRLAAALVLLAALAGPRLVTEQRRPLPDIALVVVDESPSQAVAGRLAATETTLAELRTKLERQSNLELRVERVSALAGGEDGTRLFAAVDRALARLPRRRLAAVLMITDGLVHDVPADLGRSLGAPVHVLLTGRPDEGDRRLALGRAPAFGLVGKTAPVIFRVEDKGARGEAAVTIRVDGQPFATLSVPLNRDASLDIPIRHAGQTVVELEAESGLRELSLINNRAAIAIPGVRDRLKVLLISGEPHAGERVWRNLLKADPGVDLVHFTILRPPEKDDRTPLRELSLIAFPVRELFEDKLADFDLVIFDRYRGRSVLTSAYYDNLTAYVRKGGALLAAVGPEVAEPGGLARTTLADILPAKPSGERFDGAFRPQVTPEGHEHPVTAGLAGSNPGDPPWGSWMRQMEVGPARGQTLLSGAGGRPLLVLDRVGEGRVALLLSDTLWLWARGWEGGGPHAELLRRLAHWLMKEPELEEHALRADMADGRLSVTGRGLGPGPVEATLTAPDGSSSPLVLTARADGSLRGEHPAGQPGMWRVEEPGGLVALAAAGPLSSPELAELAASAERLGPVAAATGGTLAWTLRDGIPEPRRTSGLPASGRGWMGLMERGESVAEASRDAPLFPPWLLLFLALGAILAAWIRESRA